MEQNQWLVWVSAYPGLEEARESQLVMLLFVLHPVMHSARADSNRPTAFPTNRQNQVNHRPLTTVTSGSLASCFYRCLSIPVCWLDCLKLDVHSYNYILKRFKETKKHKWLISIPDYHDCIFENQWAKTMWTRHF